MNDAIEKVAQWVRREKVKEVLDISNLGLTSLPSLPEGVEWLNCGGNPIEDLGILPASLKRLDCSETKIMKFGNLPEGLEYLHCKGCKMLKTVDNLPDSVRKLDLSYCHELEDIERLPLELRELKLIQTWKVRHIAFPPKLRVFWAEDFGLQYLPELPETLRKLICNKLDFKYYNYYSYYKTLPSVALPEFPKFPQKLKYIQMTNCGFHREHYKVESGCLYLDVTDNKFWFTVSLSSKTEYAKSDYFIFERYPGRKF
jgi:hypothetical protein